MDFKDFETFTDPKYEVSPSFNLDEKVLAMVKEEQPGHHLIFGKLLGLQVVVGVLTLLICPQFNLGVGKSYQVFHYIHHHLGMEACYAFCGAIFMGPSAFLAFYVLKDAEHERIKRVWPLHFLLLSATMLVALATFGATVQIKLIFIWFFAAIAASCLFFFCAKRLLHGKNHKLRRSH